MTLAKWKRTKTRREPEATVDGLTYEQLRRELGFDEITYEGLQWELFAEAFGLVRPDDGERREPTRVTQVGPGRRRSGGK